MSAKPTTAQAQFIKLYKECEARAELCYAPRASDSKGKAFQKPDRALLVSEMWKLNMSANTLGGIIFKEVGGTSMHVHSKRLEVFEAQVSSGVLRLGPSFTGAVKPEVKALPKTEVQLDAFDGRIKSISDVQPAFNRAARQLIKLGITSPETAFKFVTTAFETAKVEQKIDSKADRIVKELRIGDLTKEQIVATLARVKAQF